MREAAKEKMGYYPCATQALDVALTRIVPPKDKSNRFIADFCAGEGEAIHHISQYLGLHEARVFAVEIDSGRSEKIAARMPDCNLLGTTSFFGSDVGYKCYSLVILNSPFGPSRDHGRIEFQWLRKVTNTLAVDGILMMVCPHIVATHRTMTEHLETHYRNVSLVRFPDAYRTPSGNEVIVLAQRLKFSRNSDEVDRLRNNEAPVGFTYELPAARGPDVFKKTTLTDDEIETAAAQSPLMTHLLTPRTVDIRRPPLALGTGHIALLLSSGMLDGTIYPEDGTEPHVIRGTARKVEVEKSVEEEDTSKGTKVTTTIAERIEMIIRKVDKSGVIKTLK